MNPHITIAYITARKERQLHWFAASLARELEITPANVRIVIIDFYAEAHKPGDGWTHADAEARNFASKEMFGLRGFAASPFISSPIWNVWQGPHRLTRENWFAKADYLNAAICLTNTTHLACIDDLSVLIPGWLPAVIEACSFDGITCGAYRKVRQLKVEDGKVASFAEFTPGIDSRWRRGRDNGPVSCDPGLMYGCSFVVPVEAALKVDGWPHYSNGMGYEDCATGVMMGKHGYPFRYDRRMLTYESDEHHFIGKQMRRDDPGQSPNDKSHVLKRMSEELMSFPQMWPAGSNLRSIRDKVLNDYLHELPVISKPEVEPFSLRPLAELGEQVPPQPIAFVAPVAQNLPKVSMSAEVQAEIVKAHALLPGWCPMDKALLLCAEIDAMKAEIVVDIGTFGGKSTIPMAIQLRANNKGIVYAIDPWTNEEAIKGYGGSNLTYWLAMDFKTIKQSFEHQVKALKLGNFICYLQTTSDEVKLFSVTANPWSIDLLHIDGQKDETVIRDVDRFASKVRVGGVCCLNDLDWEGGHVLKAAARLLELGFVENYKIGTGAVYRRTHIPS